MRFSLTSSGTEFPGSVTGASRRKWSIREGSTDSISSGSYTFARSIDTTSGSQGTSDFSSGDFNETNYYFRQIKKSLSSFDVRNAFNFSSTYELPIGPGKMFGGGLKRVGKQILAGWQVGGIVTLHNGFSGVGLGYEPLCYPRRLQRQSRLGTWSQ